MSQHKLRGRPMHQVRRLTDIEEDRLEFFTAVDEGLRLWLAAEKALTGRENRDVALCTGSREALERAIEVLRLFARNKKLVSVRVTSQMLRHVPCGRLEPAQVIYRWKARITSGVRNPLRGTLPAMRGKVFVVRPLAENVKRGEWIVRVDVALLGRKGATPQTVPWDVEEVVDITHPLRPTDPARIAAAAREVVRFAEGKDQHLARILKTVLEELEVAIMRVSDWLQRRHAVPRRQPMLILARETGVEVVLLAAAGGGTSQAASPTGSGPQFEMETITQADAAQAALDRLVESPVEEYAAAEQNIADLLDSMPSEDEAEALRVECVRICGAANRATDAAAAELTARSVINDAWLVQVRTDASDAAREMTLGRGSHEAMLDLARRYVHGGTKTTAIAGRLAMRAASGIPESSAAHRDAIAAAQQIADSLPRFYRTPILHAFLTERLTVLHQLLERYKAIASSS